VAILHAAVKIELTKSVFTLPNWYTWYMTAHCVSWCRTFKSWRCEHVYKRQLV